MRISVGMIVLVAGFVMMSGCMSSAGSEDVNQPTVVVKTAATPPTPTTIPQTTVPPTIKARPSPVYAVGDIARNPLSTTRSGWLVTMYNPETDMYGRVLVSLDSSGMWRTADTKSDGVNRVAFEKVYTEKISGINVRGPITQTPTAEPTTTATTTQTSQITTSATPIPVKAGDPIIIIAVDPPFAFRGQSHEIGVFGAGFSEDSAVSLKADGRPDIFAKSVLYDNQNRLRVIFEVPSGSVGVYDFVVENGDGKAGIKKNGFSIS